MQASWYEICCFQTETGKEQNLTVKESMCSNCGEDCFEELGQPENPTFVPIHYFVEKEPVCCDCYQILHEIDRLG